MSDIFQCRYRAGSTSYQLQREERGQKTFVNGDCLFHIQWAAACADGKAVNYHCRGGGDSKELVAEHKQCRTRRPCSSRRSSFEFLYQPFNGIALGFKCHHMSHIRL